MTGTNPHPGIGDADEGLTKVIIFQTRSTEHGAGGAWCARQRGQNCEASRTVSHETS